MAVKGGRNTANAAGTVSKKRGQEGYEIITGRKAPKSEFETALDEARRSGGGGGGMSIDEQKRLEAEVRMAEQRAAQEVVERERQANIEKERQRIAEEKARQEAIRLEAAKLKQMSAKEKAEYRREQRELRTAINVQRLIEKGKTPIGKAKRTYEKVIAKYSSGSPQKEPGEIQTRVKETFEVDGKEVPVVEYFFIDPETGKEVVVPRKDIQKVVQASEEKPSKVGFIKEGVGFFKEKEEKFARRTTIRLSETIKGKTGYSLPELIGKGSKSTPLTLNPATSLLPGFSASQQKTTEISNLDLKIEKIQVQIEADKTEILYEDTIQEKFEQIIETTEEILEDVQEKEIKKELKREIKEDEKSLKSLEKSLNHGEKEIEKKESGIRAIENQKASILSDINMILEENKRIQQKIDEKSNEIANLEKIIEKLEKEKFERKLMN